MERNTVIEEKLLHLRFESPSNLFDSCEAFSPGAKILDQLEPFLLGATYLATDPKLLEAVSFENHSWRIFQEFYSAVRKKIFGH